MNAVFRYRYALHLLVFVLGFYAPWNYALQIDPPGRSSHVWGTLSVELARLGVLGIGQAFDAVLVLGILCAVGGAWLRTWGAAYLGSGVVKSSAMHTAEDGVATGAVYLHEDGPYRHLRNPLYVGTVLHTLAVVLLMQMSGAIFTVVLIVAMQAVLIAGEERFLRARLGEAYRAYYALVPRIWPRLRARIKGAGERPQWLQAFAGETYMWGVAVSFAVAGWWSNALLMERCLLVALGISLVMRAFVHAPRAGGAVARGA